MLPELILRNADPVPLLCLLGSRVRESTLVDVFSCSPTLPPEAGTWRSLVDECVTLLEGNVLPAWVSRDLIEEFRFWLGDEADRDRREKGSGSLDFSCFAAALVLHDQTVLHPGTFGTSRASACATLLDYSALSSEHAWCVAQFAAHLRVAENKEYLENCVELTPSLIDSVAAAGFLRAVLPNPSWPEGRIESTDYPLIAAFDGEGSHRMLRRGFKSLYKELQQFLGFFEGATRPVRGWVRLKEAVQDKLWTIRNG